VAEDRTSVVGATTRP